MEIVIEHFTFMSFISGFHIAYSMIFATALSLIIGCFRHLLGFFFFWGGVGAAK